MGYTTYFNGAFDFNKPVDDFMRDYINKFVSIAHLKRDVEKIKAIYPNWRMLGFCGELGEYGQYFIGNKYADESVIDRNRPAPGVPELWCQWMINEDGQLVWDQGEKFYEYIPWLKYLIEHFFAPNGYVLNGEMEFEGEDDEDFGVIVVTDNVVEVKYGYHIKDLKSINDSTLIHELMSRGYKVSMN